jgi:hypothetical protein
MIMKYTLTFVTGHCFPPKKESPYSLCSGYSIPATAQSTAGPDFLELHVGWSVTVPRLQGHL